MKFLRFIFFLAVCSLPFSAVMPQGAFGISGGYDYLYPASSPFEKFALEYNFQHASSVITPMNNPTSFGGYSINVHYDDYSFLGYSFGYKRNTGRMVSALNPATSSDGSSGHDIDLYLNSFYSGSALTLPFGEDASFVVRPTVEMAYGWIDSEVRLKGRNKKFEDYSGSMYSFSGGLELYVRAFGPLYIYGKAVYTGYYLTEGIKTIYNQTDVKVGEYYYEYNHWYYSGEYLNGFFSNVSVQVGVALLFFNY